MTGHGDPESGARCASGVTTVYFDGSCPLCRREIALAKKLTGEHAISFVDICDADSFSRLGPDLVACDAMAKFHVRRADGTLTNGAAAFLEMWSATPRLKFLKAVSRSPITVSALDRIYEVFLKIRPRLSNAARRIEARRARRR